MLKLQTNRKVSFFCLFPKSLSVQFSDDFFTPNPLCRRHAVVMAQVSLRVLSEHLGLTDGTVSRALNDYPDIAEKTRKRVKAAALELGYQPNPTARRLATGAAECIAYVLPAKSNHANEPFLGELLSGLSNAMLKRGWDLNITSAKSADDEIAQFKRLVSTKRASGFVVSRTLSDDPRIAALKSLGVPFITHGRTQNSDDHAWFDVDNHAAFHTAYQHLAKLGHRDIAYIGGPQKFNFAQLRYAGFEQGLRESQQHLHPEWVEQSRLTLADGEQAMLRILESRSQPPTAVLCVTDMVAIGAMRAVHSRGMVPGRDISFIGYDGLAVGSYTIPSLTTMTQPLVEAGEIMGSMLMDVIDGTVPNERQLLVDARLVQRDSDTVYVDKEAKPNGCAQ